MADFGDESMAPSVSFQSFAVIPAAGGSQRMGRPKLLLPWGAGTIIEAVLAAWRASDVTACVVVVHPQDEPLADLCRQSGVNVIAPPIAPPDMKQSVQFGLEFLRQRYDPRPPDVWLVAPGDIPRLSPKLIVALLAAHRPQQPEILIPTLAGQRGHPVLFPWQFSGEVAGLGDEEGLNQLSRRHGVHEIPCDAWEPRGASVFADIDTPADYQAAGAANGQN